MGGRLCNNGNNYWIIDPPSAVKSEKNRVKFGKTLCRVNSVEKIYALFALKMFLVIENHFGGAFEGGRGETGGRLGCSVKLRNSYVFHLGRTGFVNRR